jgi:Methyltransferase domain
MISQSSRAEGRQPVVDAGCGGVPGRPPWRRLELLCLVSREILDAWRTYGAKPALSQAKDILLAPLHRRLERQFDRRHGLETAGTAPLALLSVVDDGFDRQHYRRRYEAVPLVTFVRMMSRLPADLSDYVFIDFGSGKGRALVLAARYGFKRIIGIEFAAELHGIAKRNIEKSAPDTRIELINENALRYSIPDEKCVFYLFNPFGDQVLAEVVSNIEESYKRRPRKMVFLYVNPHGAHVLHGRTFVHLLERRRFGPKTGVIYETADPA